MPAQFKLTKANGLTRRIAFVVRPTWSLLSARIANVYDIAIEDVGVSYIDSEGDDVTLSSDEELQDFYASVHDIGDGAIKFAVQDLSRLRNATAATHSQPSATPQQSHFRNTFGGHEVLPLVFDPDDEWQRLPGSLGSLFLSKDAPESPHAFVEVLESDVSISKSEAAGSGGGSPSRSDLVFATAAPNKDKGKARAPTVEDDVSSAGSVIGDETPTKPPVHVFGVGSENVFGLSRRSSVQPPRSGNATPAQAQSTPLISEQALKVDGVVETGEQKAEVLDDDPPLPSLDSPNPDHVPPSLVHDIATLLTTISTILSTHPELSGHLHNIVANATNGTYWAAHRDAISRAAESFRRSAIQETGRSLEELRRATEQEASARVSEAIGGIFRTIGNFTHSGPENDGLQPPRTANQVSPDETTPSVPRSLPNVAPSFPRFPHLPPRSRRDHHPWFTPPRFTHPGGQFWGGPTHLPPPPPPPFSPQSWPRPPPPPFWDNHVRQISNVDNGFEARVVAAEARARTTEQHAQTTAASSTSEASPEVLRAEVETAKADYRARKERYRQAKAIRKMADRRRHAHESTEESLSRETSDNPTLVTPDKNVPTAAIAPTLEHQAAESEVHIVSNARGRYPQLEMFSVPKFGHPAGHMPRGPVHDNKENRPFHRIMRKLSDMGFTEGTYSNLTAKVMDQLFSHPPVTKDAEDDIVTNLIEELISRDGGGPPTGGSSGIPGAWH